MTGKPNPGTEASDDIAYADAMAELEAILAEIEQEDVDIDVLAEKVRRASDLVRICRERIQGARMHVEQVVTEMSETGEEA
jgi:exodeoxyribonuclease VII small subunit